MKNVTKSYAQCLLLIVMTASSCGNPHLIKSDLLSLSEDESKTVDLKDSIDQGNTLVQKQLEVVNKEGGSLLSFGSLPSNIEVSKTLIVKNHSDSDLPLNLKFENGLAYDFSGGRFPGLNGSCTEKLKAHSECTVEIIFRSNDLGLFEDVLTLISQDYLIFTIPLSGERRAGDSDNTSNIIVQNNTLNNSLGTTVDFGPTAKGALVSKEIELNNTLEKNITISDFTLGDQNVFKIVDLGSCTKVVKPGSCKLNITFNPNEIKSYNTNLTIKDENNAKLVLKLSGVGVEQKKCTTKSEIIQKPSIQRSAPLSSIVFPYLSSHPKTSSRLKKLYGSDFNVHIKGVSIRTVKDAQVLLEYKMPSADLTHLSDIKIDLDIWKIINDGYKDTEMICLSSKNFKRCSGRIYTLESWKKLLNPQFWNQGGVISNTLFEDRLAQTEKKCGEKNCEVLREELSFKELFSLTETDLQKLINEKIFHLVLADDSRFLNFPALKLKSESESQCTTNEVLTK
ncbi:MAG: choice-of-anchor D domain-containing protein [Bacteriovorax sp.]|nr:choice-of-anchor D domain-containing protein [Bacteriovorax sp.]